MSTATKFSTRNRLMPGILLTATMLLTGCIAGLDYDRPATTSNQHIYVASSASVLEFAIPTTATVNMAPTINLAGTTTTMSDAHRIAFDATGNMYVSDHSNNKVDIFPAGATGNIAPTASITGLNQPSGIAFDASGRLYVANQNTNTHIANSKAILVFAAGATGAATPVAIITGSNTGLNEANGIALDSTGKIYVCNESGNTVTVYAANPVGTLNETPIATISGGSTGLNTPHDLTLDPSGKIYVVTANGNSILVFAAGATGNVAPVAQIIGSLTTLGDPNGISLDSTGKIYVGNQNAVDVFAANPTGTLNEAPLSIITGSNTGLGGAVHGVTLY